MRVFQNSGLYPAYRSHFQELAANVERFAARIEIFVGDRYGACHLLAPVLCNDASAFLTNGDDENTQRIWAQENGLSATESMEKILLAQIEHHRAEVFYNMDPMRYGSGFVRQLPGCVKKAVAWRAAPSPGADFGAYDLVVCNFPGILEGYRRQGWKAAYFSPAHDPEMDAYAANRDRPIDVLFVGGYSRHHRRRAAVLEAVAGMAPDTKVVMHLDCSRLTRLAESPLGKLLPLARHRRPSCVVGVARGPVFGRALYEAIGRAKIVLNGAVDMAGNDRGNMRCFEAMGCGALMVSDSGNYPEGMVNAETMIACASEGEVVSAIRQVLKDSAYRQIAERGYQMIRTRYSKERQWLEFRRLVGEVA